MEKWIVKQVEDGQYAVLFSYKYDQKWYEISKRFNSRFFAVIDAIFMRRSIRRNGFEVKIINAI